MWMLFAEEVTEGGEVREMLKVKQVKMSRLQKVSNNQRIGRPLTYFTSIYWYKTGSFTMTTPLPQQHAVRSAVPKLLPLSPDVAFAL